MTKKEKNQDQLYGWMEFMRDKRIEAEEEALKQYIKHLETRLGQIQEEKKVLQKKIKQLERELKQTIKS